MVSSDVCCNFNDVDPISLEPIRSLDSFFYLTDKASGRVEACDSVAWLRYFALTPEQWPRHPCTRARLDAQDVWDCYLSAWRTLGAHDDAVQKMNSRKIYAAQKNRRVVLRPASPLFSLSLRSLGPVKNETGDPANLKKIRVSFFLVRSCDSSQRVGDLKTLTVQIPSDYNLSLTA